ncbi:Alpha/Beta hydrolase protein [Limtongia smithiae]|uniref:Alpha/Beta hydrolase protein n=1 Tax=Limtongia smithiae TaxID=1125753 RepID=UPI0034CE4AEF
MLITKLWGAGGDDPSSALLHPQLRMYVPLIGRVAVTEWPPLVFGIVLVAVEWLLRVVTRSLPGVVICAFESVTRKIYMVLLPSTTRERTIVHSIHDAQSFSELCGLFGHEVEEHVVRTADGYVLGLHRVLAKGETIEQRRRQQVQRPVVYLHHGLLMDSEIWTCVTDARRSLPLVLVEAGYDVWVGNNRGNKYSKKHVLMSSADAAFWDFSMDELAMYDIPDTIEYVLDATGAGDLAYIGFSQGSAQAFGALALYPALNRKVRVFVALAPALAPHGLRFGLVDALVKASPGLMYLTFGRRAILSSAVFWQSIMYPPLFVRLIDSALALLFEWRGRNMSMHQKIAAYAHLYSFTSVKTVVHWFQIMRHSCFQMFDDDVNSPVRMYGTAFYRVAQFPTRNIRTPIYLVYGTADSLVDIDAMRAALPPSTVAVPVAGHEHLDIVWGDEVHRVVIPHVLQVLADHYGEEEQGRLDEKRSDDASQDASFQDAFDDGDDGEEEDEEDEYIKATDDHDSTGIPASNATLATTTAQEPHNPPPPAAAAFPTRSRAASITTSTTATSTAVAATTSASHTSTAHLRRLSAAFSREAGGIVLGSADAVTGVARPGTYVRGQRRSVSGGGDAAGGSAAMGGTAATAPARAAAETGGGTGTTSAATAMMSTTMRRVLGVAGAE